MFSLLMNMDKQVNRDTQDRASHNTPPHGLLLSIHSLGASMSEKQVRSKEAAGQEEDKLWGLLALCQPQERPASLR